MRKTRFSLIMFSILAMIASVYAFSGGPDDSGPLLWEIEGESPSYILGTIHLPDSRVTNLPRVVQEKFTECGTFVMEIEMNTQASMEIAGMMLLPGDTTISDLVSDEMYERIKAQLESMGQDITTYQKFKPWAINMIISIPRDTSVTPMDMMLYEWANNQEKEVVGLETVKQQVSLFDGLTYEQQIEMMDETIEEYEQYSEYLENMVGLYLDGDLEGLYRFINEFSEDEEDKAFMDALLTKRNYRMVGGIIPQVDKGGAFIAVGAGHLAGDEGILKLLEDKGYKLTRVKAIE